MGADTDGKGKGGQEAADREARAWAALHKVREAMSEALGDVDVGALPGHDATDAGTRLAVRRTSLALERSFQAAERTLMAWVRTALAMISFGFTIGKIGQALKTVEVKGFLGGERSVSTDSLAYFLVVLGSVGLAGALVQFRVRVRELRRAGLRGHFSFAFVVGLVLVVVGFFTLTALVWNL